MMQRDPITALGNGELVVMVDHHAPEAGAELWLAAGSAQAEQFARLVRYTSGFVSVAISAARANTLGLPPMVMSPNHFSERRPVPAVTCDAAEGGSTGISAADRALTARLLADPAARPEDFKRPGHLVPLRVRERVTDPGSSAHAALELCAIAGLRPAMVRCELVTDSGALASAQDGLAFARRHGLAWVARDEVARVSAVRIA
jgi:3,4-dihydroxy-2-butanone 4-phosphate synthase